MADKIEPQEEKEIRNLLEALRREAPRFYGNRPALDRPPVMDIPEEKLRIAIREAEAIVDRKLVDLEKRIEEFVHKEIMNTCRLLGLRIDEEHIDETRDQIISLLKIHKRADKIIGHIIMTFVVSMFFGVLGLLGWKLNSGGGGGH